MIIFKALLFRLADRQSGLMFLQVLLDGNEKAVSNHPHADAFQLRNLLCLNELEGKSHIDMNS